jgi:hypothetical protein
MIEQLQLPTSTASIALVGFSALLASAPISWPVREEPAYVVPHGISTVGSNKIVVAPVAVPAMQFDREIAGVYASLLEGQEPLGSEFEAIWDAHVDSLYEA